MSVTGISSVAPMPVQPQFGAKPPQLFSRVTNDQRKPDGKRYEEGDVWENPDGEFTDDEIKDMLKEPAGVQHLFAELGPKELKKRLGVKGIMSEMHARRLVKELMKYAGGDTMQSYTPRVVYGHWVHMHDQWHMDMGHGRLKFGPFEIGDKKVNGVNGLGSKTVPHFHPEDDAHDPEYDGMLDEFLVASYAYAQNPNWVNRLRVGMYLAKLTPEHGLAVPREFRRAVKRFRAEA